MRDELRDVIRSRGVPELERTANVCVSCYRVCRVVALIEGDAVVKVWLEISEVKFSLTLRQESSANFLSNQPKTVCDTPGLASGERAAFFFLNETGGRSPDMKSGVSQAVWERF